MGTSVRLENQQDRLDEALGRKYQVICRIGGGGMAQVYLARHQVHGGLFAVKVLVDRLAEDPSVVARFQQEARMAATLANHPNIVPIFDIGSGCGLHYMIMQFVPGENLASYLRREGRLSLPDTANVVTQTAEALSCADAKRIVHRDLKPANMLLDNAGCIKLLDFGISRIADFADGLTRPGESIGTPHYMSPEQIRGEPCDSRSDLYSLGVVFFELASGHRPFEYETRTAIQNAHLSSRPPSLLAFDPMLPQWCDTIVQRLLAKKPVERYQSTTELLKDLVAHGANRGPGTLRPIVDADLRQALERAESIPLDRTADPLTALVSTDLELPNTASDNIARRIAQNRGLSATAGEQGEAKKKSQARRPEAIAVVVFFIAAGAIALVMIQSRRGTSLSTAPTSSAVQIALPQVYSDDHGRMMLVNAGPFLFERRGISEAKTITLPAFYVDETEVSNMEYRRFCQATGHPPPQTRDYKEHPDYPVSGVSKEDAEAYAEWAGRRLPSEEEWEKAARGSDTRTFPWGDAPWNSDIPKHLEAVKSEPSRRSPYGAYNMAGNVWEWTASIYPTQASDMVAMRRLLGGQPFSPIWQVIKGGSFSSGGYENFAISKRRGLPRDARSPWIGFRCVRDVHPPS